MQAVNYRVADPDRDFKQLAKWFTFLEESPTTEKNLLEFYQSHQSDCINLVVENSEKDLLGFYWVDRLNSKPIIGQMYIFIKPDFRKRGLGSHLFDCLLSGISSLQLNALRVGLNATWQDGLTFLLHRRFFERGRSIGMELDLKSFDDKPYDAIISSL